MLYVVFQRLRERTARTAEPPASAAVAQSGSDAVD